MKISPFYDKRWYSKALFCVFGDDPAILPGHEIKESHGRYELFS
jgi:hypothetical protein